MFTLLTLLGCPLVEDSNKPDTADTQDTQDTQDTGVEGCPVGVAALPDANAYGAAVVLDNTLYLFGGYVDDEASAAGWAWRGGAWEALAPMPTAVTHPAIGAADGKIWVITGYDGGAKDAVQIYDVASDSWTTGTPWPEALENVGYAQEFGTLYVVGGYRSSVFGTNRSVDLSTGTVSDLAPMTLARDRVAVAFHGGAMYVMGGQTSNSMQFDPVEVYDPVGNSWASGPALTEARSNAMAVDAGGTLFVVGGGRSMTGTPEYLDYLEALVDDSFVVVGHLPEARTMASVTACEANIYVLGGVGPDGELRDTVLEVDTLAL